MKIQLKFVAILIFAIALSFTACVVDSSDVNGDSEITIAAIAGVTPPAIGETPVTVISETAQYTGTVTWDGNWTGPQTFAGSKAYTATIMLTPKSGYTLSGVTADFFTIVGATMVSNTVDSVVITALFPATDTVSIGDAILGGKVAYILQSGDPGYVADEQRGLIAATADQSTGIMWAIAAYQSAHTVPLTSTILGSGKANTDIIIAQNGAGSTYAAGLARAYNGGGYFDWYLPSIIELDKLYLNRAGVGGFSSNSYWSSSEVLKNMAWYQYFGTGGMPGQDLKAIACRVRSVRSF